MTYKWPKTFPPWRMLSSGGNPQKCTNEHHLDNLNRLAWHLNALNNFITTTYGNDYNIICLSGYRTYNYHFNTLGLTTNSKHLTGQAMDFKLNNCSTEVAWSILMFAIHEGIVPDGGCGYYHNRFIHYDIRGKTARWGD